MARLLIRIVIIVSLSLGTIGVSARTLKHEAGKRLARSRRAVQYEASPAQVMAKCNGTDDTATLNSAVKTAGAGMIVISVGVTCAVRDITLPNLRVEKGGLLKVSSGRTAKLSNVFESGSYQVFDNVLPAQGYVSFEGNTSLREVYPEWWGGLTTAAPATQMGAFQRAVDTGIPVRLAATLTGNGYTLDNSATPLMLDKAASNTATITGAGMDVTLVRCTSTARPCVQIDYRRPGAPSVIIRDIHLRGAAGPVPNTIAGNVGIYAPGYHDGIAHQISNLVIENMQIDQFGDSGIRIQGDTGPVRIINPVVNDVGDYGIQISSDNNPAASQSQDVTIDGGSVQGHAKGGIAVIGGKAAILSLTIRDVDIELRESQTKPTLYLEQVHGAYVSGVTVASIAGSLSVGDANVYLANGVYGCTFTGIVNAARGGLHNVHAAGVTNSNTFIGGAYVNKASGPGYLFKREAGSTNNVFINMWASSGTFQRDHDSLPDSGPKAAAFDGRVFLPLTLESAQVFFVLSMVSMAVSPK